MPEQAQFAAERPNEPVVPTRHDAEVARESCRLLSQFSPHDIRIQAGSLEALEIDLPPSAVDLLVRLLSEMADGNAVTLTSSQQELTTQQAAQILGVSRPFLVKLLDERRIPFRWVGSHRRVLLCHLKQFKDEMDAQRHEILDELARHSQNPNMGY